MKWNPIESLKAQLNYWYTNRAELYEECDCSAYAGMRIGQLEEMRELAAKYELSAEYLEQIDEMKADLIRVRDLDECAEAGGSGRIQ